MFERYTDQNTQDVKRNEFTKRRYGKSLIFLFSAFIGAYIVTLLFLAILLPSQGFGRMLALLMPVSGVIFGVLFYVAASFVQRSRDFIMATEFQNAIFAGAVRTNTRFSLIVRRDGSSIYSDIGFNNQFSTLRRRGLRGLALLLEYDGISREERKTLLDAITAKKRVVVNRVVVNIVLEDNSPALLCLEPIELPFAPGIKGETEEEAYFCVRAFDPKHMSGFGAFFEHAPLPVFAVDEQNIVDYANAAFREFTGWNAAEPLQMGDITEVELDCRANGIVQLQIQAGGSTVKVLDVPLFTDEMVKPHRIYHVLVPLSLMKNQGAGTSMVVAGEGNISYNHLWYFLENSPIAEVMLNEYGTVMRSNSAFRTMVEREGGEENGWDFLDIIQENSRAGVLHLLKEATSEEVGMPSHLRPIEVQLYGNKGMSALLYINRLQQEGGEPMLIGHLIDTTEQKNLELRFVHSQKMQAVGQLAGGIAHDFNNLLTAMIGFCDLLLIRHPAGDQSFADIMQIKQNANRAANLVRQLLAFSRKQTLQPEIIDITGVLAELSNLVRRLIGENIELKMNHGRDLGLVKVDQGQLEQVIINLAVNARDAMEGGGVLTIQTSNKHIEPGQILSRELVPPAEDEVISAGDYVLIEVVDTGHGISHELMGKIFEPFFSTKEVGSGTGLGLSTVYGIVKQTGGFIYVTSKEEQGTKFSIFLKSYAQSEARQTELKEVEQLEKVALNDLTGKGTVLLVEDEAPVRIFSAHALMNKGYVVLEADSGEAALDIVEKRGSEIDIIITDVIMPGMNGPTMIEEISRTYPNIKVIFISGYAEDAFIKTYGTERKFNFLPKPFTLKQLAGKVKEVLMKEEV